jgi:site-specific DNA recombinase
VTQQFNTATSMGRLVLNVLLSFAQFEREIISERTRDKIAATRRKGKWSGGLPILGYDVLNMRLVVNDREADVVRVIFDLYLRQQSLSAVVAELSRRGWVNKRWKTRKGTEVGGGPFTKSSLHKLLTNVLYVGNIQYKREIHAGEHAGIVAQPLWQEVQNVLHAQARAKKAMERNRMGAILKGLLRCVSCGRAMTPSQATRKDRSYRYYVCTGAQKIGWQSCPMPSVAAPVLEQAVLEQLKELVPDAALVGYLVDQPWQTLPPPVQARLVRSLVARVDFHGQAGKLVIALHANGLDQLAAELVENTHDTAPNG